MNIRKFVSGSSVILAAWLGATFLNEVPAQRYPKLDKTSAVTPLTADKSSVVASAKIQSHEFPASISH